jgi:uncharacterized protein YyaL (SSP411 family)
MLPYSLVRIGWSSEWNADIVTQFVAIRPVGRIQLVFSTTRANFDPLPFDEPPVLLEVLPMSTFDPKRNNLAEVSSPYLRQHADNPVWWQEWNSDTLSYAAEAGKPLFVSVGYATCHWCHVMAAEAFSDPDVATFLNTHFVSIKVDREERPDIDHFLMQFLLATRGNGGWPLNAFLATPRRPVLALTYVPVQPRNGLPGFIGIAEQVVDFIDTRRDELKDVTFRAGDADAEGAPATEIGATVPIPDLDTIREEAVHRVQNLLRRFDRSHGGFGTSAKFPPHSTLLYLLHAVDLVPMDERQSTDTVIQRTLNAIARRGLHDHLQGGFFRYCVDREWTIPHFEKMLYDQALLLWVFALGYHRYGNEWYRDVAEGIVRSLEETFAVGDVFVSAHDADTDHREGGTYLWTEEELAAEGQERSVLPREPGDAGSERTVFTQARQGAGSERTVFTQARQGAGSEHTDAKDSVFTVEELSRFLELVPGGNFEGKHHLLRRNDGQLSPRERSLLERLLLRRRRRPQPGVDGKVVTSWNALAGIGLVVAGRYLNRPEWIERAWRLRSELYRRNITVTEDGKVVRVARSSLGEDRSNGAFLEDHAALLLFETYLAETLWKNDRTNGTLLLSMEALRNNVLRFRDEGSRIGWVTSHTDDFESIPADEFDAPTPSPIALAELALLRSDEFVVPPQLPDAIRNALNDFGAEQVRDFHNIATLLAAGEFHVVHRIAPIDWNLTPIATILVPAERNDWCYHRVCRPSDPDWMQNHTEL